MTGDLVVVDVLRSQAGQRLVRSHIDAPHVGAQVGDGRMTVVGWAFGLEQPVHSVQITSHGQLLAEAEVGMSRPDLAEAFGDRPDPAVAGFRADLLLVGYAEVRLEVSAVLADGSRHLVGVIEARRDAPPEPSPAASDLVGVVVHSDGCPEPLHETLDSLSAQTHERVEVVVVGAGEVSALEDAVAAYPGVELVMNGTAGRGAAWNSGLDATRADHLMFVPAGVRLAADAVEASVQALLRHREWSFVTGQASGWRPGPPQRTFEELLRTRPEGGPAVVAFRREAIEAAGRFDERLAVDEDYELCLRIARRCPFGTHDAVAVEKGNSAAPPVGAVAFGHLRRTRPIGDDFGFGRGRPVDRYYIEDFLERHAEDISGHVLEVASADYTRRFGGDSVEQADVLSLEASGAEITYTADLADAPSIPDETYDCFVLTQTLHLIWDLRPAVDTVFRILKPGGIVLATVPGTTQTESSELWQWTLTPLSAHRLFAERFGHDVRVESHGNVLASTALLQGIAAEELTYEELDYRDHHYPVTVAVRARKPPAHAA
jgi:SAM-dependent methyltransferase